MLKLLWTTGLSCIVLAGCNVESSTPEIDTRTMQEKLQEIKDSASLEIPDDASLAETMLYSLGVDKATRAIYVMSVETNAQTALAANPKLDKAELDEYINFSTIALNEELPLFISQAATVYEEFYSEEEIIEILNFYKTETGQKFINTQTQLMSDMLPLGEDLGQRINVRTTELLNQK